MRELILVGALPEVCDPTLCPRFPTSFAKLKDDYFRKHFPHMLCESWINAENIPLIAIALPVFQGSINGEA